MSVKIPYAIVELQVLKLYERGYELTNVNEITRHFDFITEFIKACGWTIDDYTSHLMQWDSDYNYN